MSSVASESDNYGEAVFSTAGSEHGASSEKNTAVDTDTPLSASFTSDLLKSALKRAARKTYSVSWDETLASAPKLSCLQLAESLLGCRSKSPCWTYLNFVNTEGRSLGTGVLAVCKAWGIRAHPDAPKELGFHIDRMEKPKSWSWSVFKRKVEICVQASEGSTSPLCILLYSCTLPRYVVAQLKEMLLKEVRSSDDPSKVNVDSPLLNWQKVEDPGDTDYVNDVYLQQVQDLYTGWITCCDRIVQNVEKLMLDDDSRKEDSNPVLLVRRWCNLPSRGGKMELGKIIDEETFLHGRLSTVGTGHITISWKARIELYKLVLQSFPRFREKDTAFCVFVGDLTNDAAGITDTQGLARAVQRLADSSGCSTVDEYLGIDQSAGAKRNFSSPGGDLRKVSHDSSKRPRSDKGVGKSHSKELASVKLGLPADIVKSRFDAGLCLRCGNSGHKVRDCPNAVSSSSGAPVSSASDYPQKEVAFLSLGVPLKRNLNESLLTAPVKLTHPSSDGTDGVECLAGLDTMSSVNLVDSQLVHRLQCALSDGSTKITTVNGTVSADGTTTIRVCLSGYVAELPFVVVEHLPRVDVLIGHRWLPQLGVTLTVPKPEQSQGEAKAHDLFSPVDHQIDRAKEFLVGELGNIYRLPGAHHYFGRLRRARFAQVDGNPADILDDPKQTMVFEVWPDSGVAKNRSRSAKKRPLGKQTPVDFSKSLIARLSPEQQAEFRVELQSFIDKGWWREVPRRSAEDRLLDQHNERETPFCYPAVSFPIIQKSHKSTRCRLVTDCRCCNLSLPAASYEGFSVTECISLIRANWRNCFSLAFLDLSKAFYKVHLGEGGKLLILSDGRTFECDRLAFGLVHGPASLSGQVLLLLNSAFSGLMGRDIRGSSTREFVGLVPGLLVIPYYDDIILCGLPHLCERLASILTAIAPLIGANFPKEKTDWVYPTAGTFRHLGCFWSRRSLGELCIRCTPPDADDLSLPKSLSRRRVFQIAGARYDGVRLHPIARLVADKLRRWAGSSPFGNSRKGWDYRWPLTEESQKRLQALIEHGGSDGFGSCCHSSVPLHHRHILGFCDASDAGWGFVLYTGVCVPRNTAPDLRDSNPAFHLLEASAGEWSESNGSLKWHINRKEAHALHRCLECTYEWLSRFLDSHQRFSSVTIFCDNTSALSWALRSTPLPRSYDRVALDRMVSSLADLRKEILEQFHMSVDLQHIAGLHNYLADQLSRHPVLRVSLPDFDCSMFPSTEAGHENVSREDDCPNEISFIALTDSDELATVFDRGSSHKFALLEPVDVSSSFECVHDGVTLLISDDISDNEQPSTQRDVVEPVPNSTSDLRGVGDMSDEDALLHVSEVLTSPSHLTDIRIGGVQVAEVIALLNPHLPEESISEFPDPSESAINLVNGSPHGPYLRWDLERGLLLVSDPLEQLPCWRIFLPDQRSRLWAFYQAHDHPLRAAHQGVDKTLHALRHPSASPAFWWPSMVCDVKRLIRCCKVCQMNRHHELQNSQPLVHRRWQGRFECVQLDFMKLHDNQLTVPSPLGNPYYGIIVDEGTLAMKATPTRSTTIQDAMSRTVAER